VKKLSAGSEGSWVKECVEDGGWVYKLHVYTGGKSSVIWITANGSVIPPNVQEPEPESYACAGG
jgi:hypothetical protein